jgi:superfamily II DNA or RNA helicase
MCVELYKHNKTTYEKIIGLWKESNRVAIVQPTGSGKSFVILKCCEDFNDNNKIIFAPTNEILNQFEEHANEYNIKNYKLITYTELSFMSDENINNLNPSLIVFDEFHRCGAPEWGKGVQRLLDTYSNAKVLGASATPIRYLEDGRDMSDELFDGHLAVNMSLADALVDHILPMPKYISALYTLNEELDKLNNKIKNSSNSDESKKELHAQVKLMKQNLDKSHGIPTILNKYLSEYKNGKFIVFCKNIEHLNEMKETVVSWFRKAKINKDIRTYSIYSSQENGNTEFNNFKEDNANGIKLLFSIEMLNEGVHLTDVTGAILLRVTTSPTIYYQQIGRVIDADKDKGFQPIIFDFVNNFDSIKKMNLKNDIEETVKKRNTDGANSGDLDFKEINLSEFRIYDEIQNIKDLLSKIEGKLIDNWDAMYNKLVEYYNKYGDCNVNTNKIGLGYWVGTQRQNYKLNKLSIEQIEKLQIINFIFDISENRFDIGYNHLLEYINKYKTKNVSWGYRCDDNFNLYSWINNIRIRHRQNLLSIDQTNRLEKIEFIWNPTDEAFENGYNHLIEYVKEKQNTLVPSNYICNDGYRLGIWVSHQRKNFKSGNINDEKIIRLDKLGFSWNKYDSQFVNGYNHLLEYIRKNNSTNVPLRYICSDGFKLGAWACSRRLDYRTNTLASNQVKQLNSVNFNWNPPRKNKSSGTFISEGI